jgi:3-oxoadipate enol-lactonase
VFVSVNGARLAVSDSGGDGDPVVFVHAGVADRRMWAPLAAELPAGLRLITYDMRGFGDSELPPGGYSDARDLVALLDELSLERVALVGASQGGRVALEVASAWPERIGALVLLDAAVEDHDWSAQVREFGAAEGAAVEAGDVDRAVELNVRLWVDGPREPEAVPSELRELVTDMQRRAIELQIAVEAEEDAVGVEPERITAPTLIVVGELDVPDFHAIADRLAEGIPGARRETVAGVAHLPSLEKPAEVARLIASALPAPPPPAGTSGGSATGSAAA